MSTALGDKLDRQKFRKTHEIYKVSFQRGLLYSAKKSGKVKYANSQSLFRAYAR